MSRAPETPLTYALVDAVKASGGDFEPRQLERWRALGWIPTPDRPGQGRGVGRSSSYEPEVFAYVVAFALRSQQSVPGHETVLWLLIDGIDVPEEIVRRAFVALIRSTFGPLTKLAEAGDEFDNAIEFAERSYRSRRSITLREYRDAFAELYRRVRESGRWDHYVAGDLQTTAEYVKAELRDIFLATTAPAEVVGDSLTDIATATLDRASMRNLRDLGAEVPAPEDFAQTLSMFLPSALEQAANTVRIDVVLAAASDVRTQRLFTFWRVEPGVRPKAGTLLAPLLVAMIAPLIGAALKALERNYPPSKTLTFSG